VSLPRLSVSRTRFSFHWKQPLLALQGPTRRCFYSDEKTDWSVPLNRKGANDLETHFHASEDSQAKFPSSCAFQYHTR
jgi:hypothetical protein